MLTIGDLRPTDRPASHALARQAFNAPAAHDPDEPDDGEGRHVAAYRDDALVGQVRRFEFGQYFGGRVVPCAGISGVIVVPEARGESLARRMLHETFDRAAADGEVVAALFPTTASLYRSVGFEVAGWWVQHGIPLAALPGDGPLDGPLDGRVAWERVEPGDSRAIAVYDRMASQHDGWLRLPERVWARRAMRARRDETTNRFHYLGHRRGEPVAALEYAYATSEAALYRIDVDALHGVDGDAVRSALAFLGAHGTTADEVRTTTPVDVLELQLAHPQRLSVHRAWPWMLAFVDVAGAVAARGYPGPVTGSVALTIRDPHRPVNDGAWTFTVAGGRGTLEGGGDGRVGVAASDLAAVFTGHLDPGRLAGAGRLTGATAADVELLRAAFAGRPSLTTFF